MARGRAGQEPSNPDDESAHDAPSVAADVREVVVPPNRVLEAEDAPIWNLMIDSRDISQNIVLRFAEVAGIAWSTSQCSTILPSGSSRKMSMPAQLHSPGHS
jgi:hypothetical protein